MNFSLVSVRPATLCSSVLTRGARFVRLDFRHMGTSCDKLRTIMPNSSTIPPMSSAAMLARTLLRPEILALQAYHVPDSAGYIKLDAMENPYELPPALRREIADAVAAAPVNRYPDPAAAALRQKICALSGLTEGQGVLLGNGSDELIQLLALALKQPGAALLSVEPSFVMYRMIATFTGMRYVGVPLREDFALDLPATLDAIRKQQPALIFLAYPNNPTGNLYPAEQVAQIIRAAEGLVVIDEA